MDLTAVQKLSLEHLANAGITDTDGVIAYCERNLARPQRGNHRKTPHLRVPGRKHPRKHYQGILDHFVLKTKHLAVNEV